MVGTSRQSGFCLSGGCCVCGFRGTSPVSAGLSSGLGAGIADPCPGGKGLAGLRLGVGLETRGAVLDRYRYGTRSKYNAKAT